MKFTLAQALIGLTGAATMVVAAPRAAAPAATPDPLLLARKSETQPDAYEIVRRQDTGGGPDALTGFCARWQQGCINVCMANAKVGSTQKVTYTCKTDSAGAVFTMGCKCGTTDRTSNVLTLLGGLTTSTKYTSTKTSTSKTTTKPTVTSTLSTTSTSSETLTFHTSTTETDSTTKTESYSTTTTSLVLIPTTFVSTSVLTVPTTIQTTVTATSVSIGTLPIATTLPYTVLEVSFANDPSAQLTASKSKSVQVLNSKKRATDVFCTNYFDACSRQCTRVKSSPSKQTCSRTSTTAFSYKLVCLCKNGYTETRHALADLQQSLVVQSTLAFATTTQTVTQNQTTTLTLLDTSTLTFLTETTHLFTVTDTSTYRTTSTSVSLTTYSPGTTTKTTTTKPVSTQTATSTVLNIIAPTGALRARHALNDSSVGYVNLASSFNRMQIGTQDKASAQQFMLVTDNSNSLYTLVRASDMASVVCEYDDPNASVPNFGTTINAMCLPQVLSSTKPYGPAAMLPAGNFYGGAIERYIWSPLIGVVGGTNTLKLFAQWVNTDYSRPNTYLVHQGADLFASGNKGYVSNRLGGGVDTDQLYLAIEP